jgi:putative colanic acid biosynthesis acetyltransferase WcaF
MNLGSFDNSSFDRGASIIRQVLWFVMEEILFSSLLPGSVWRCKLLAIFGAQVGQRVVIKPNVHIKFPWKLKLGDDCWIGESVWIDNLDWVSIGDNSCVSQGVYLCTGSHDWSKPTFDLITKPIVIGEQAWVGAFCKVAPGVKIAPGSVCAMGSVVTKSTGEWEIWAGSPFQKLKDRPRYEV